MNRKQLRITIDELKKELGIPKDEKIRIILRPMKTKAASISLKNGTIRLNKNLITKLNPESIRYLLLHELIHFKLKSINHNGNFQKQLTSKIEETRIREIENKIISNLLELNKQKLKNQMKFSGDTSCL